MFCSNCGNQSRASSLYCTNCGYELAHARPAKKIRYRLPRRVIIGSSLVVASVIAVGSLFALGTNQLRDETTSEQPRFDNVLVTADEFDFPLETYSESDWSFEGEMYDCVQSKEFDRLILGAKVLHQSILSHRGEVQIDFELRQTVVLANSNEDALSLIQVLEFAARDCSQPSVNSENSYGGNVYKNYRTVSDEFGLSLEGGIIDIESSICLEGCEPSGKYKLVVARKGAHLLLLRYGYEQNTPYEKVEDANQKMILYADFKDNIPAILGRFNG